MVPIESARARAMAETRNRIVDVAREVLGQRPDAGMAEIASAAGVVRRTVYGHFPARADLVETLAGRAADEVKAVLDEVNASTAAADAVWIDFVVRLWPLAHRYRVLLALRRGEHGDQIHTLLRPVDQTLTALVQRGQDEKAFGRHLPADILSQVAFSAVFAIADNTRSGGELDARAAGITSLLLLGVPEARASALADGQR